MPDNVVFITREPSSQPKTDGNTNPSVIEAQDLGTSGHAGFGEYIEADQQLQLTSAGVISDSLSGVSGLYARVETSGTVHHETWKKREDSDPLAKIDGEKDLEFKIKNLTGTSQSSVSGRWVYRIVGIEPPATLSGWPMLGARKQRTSTLNTTGTGSTVSEKWIYNTGDISSTAPAVTGGSVYVGNNSNVVYSLDASDGSEEWSHSVASQVKQVSVFDSVAYATAGGTLYALNTSDGSEKWTFATSEFEIVTSPLPHDGTVYITAEDNAAYAVSMSDGSEEWSFSTGDLNRSSPTLSDGVIFFGSSDNNVYALSASDGTEEWSYTAGGSVRAAPAIANDTVYVGSADSNMYALAESDGTEQWSYTAADRIYDKAAVGGGSVYFLDYSGVLYSLDASNGSEEWSVSIGSYSDMGPSLVDGKLYIGSDDSTFYARDPADGSEIWSYSCSDRVLGDPAVNEGTVYTTDFTGRVYALQ